ncbi:MAG TPA: phospho-sugar mutase [Streptosporangiaceae bacterium]|nr:phospho-sugar mutase [Streptosporangiaceae bacterium]
MISDDLRGRLGAWLADDPDERDRAELEELARDDSDSAQAELADRFAGRLEFGTAGLRGAVAAGPNRMNRAVVRGTTAALAQWLLSHQPRGGGTSSRGVAEAGVVIGCDARHRSDEFADEAARVLAGAGIRVHLIPRRQPTPLLAFAVRHLGAAAGIMVTASHNPPADNGYKLYLGDGAQIIPPADAEIESAIRGLSPLSQIPLGPPDSPLITWHGDEVAQAYLDAICAVSPAPPGAAWLRFVYTPLHGVAAGLALRAFEQAGFSSPDVVTAQATPDPDFPTVVLPNPEEPGALDLALAQARRSGADLVLANDPDGDRLAVAVPDPGAAGGWRMLTGDQVGALLGAYLLDSGQRDPDRLVVTTIVSSTMLSRIAAAAGAQYAETLTGFKWIVRAGESRPGSRFVLGYEEALGYSVGDTVRDKDGIGAALALLGLASRARSGGESLLDVYDALETAHGVHLTAQLTVATTTPVDVMARLRAAPPAGLGGEAVTAITDLTGGTRELPSADVLSYQLPGARVVIRPSGTEPKIKAYLEVVEPVAAGHLAAARRAAATQLAPLREAVQALLQAR